MRNLTLILLSVIIHSALSAQDYLSVPSSNPQQFPTKAFTLGEKLDVPEEVFMYQYDTLELPFIDDFSIDHFPARRNDTAITGLADTTLYSLFIGGIKFTDTTGFKTDTTYRYVKDFGLDTITRMPNPTVLISFADLNNRPIERDTFVVFPAYDIYDTTGLTLDTNFLTSDYRQDSVTLYIVPPNPNDFYTDRSAYRNTTFAINPPSIGVVTFDGLNEFGLPYDINNEIRVKADYMTSVPINLSNLPDDNVFFSFFYQPKGLSLDKPEREDSLVVEFYNPQTGRWGHAWNAGGFESDTFLQVILEVPNKFHQNGFRFRFRNYASSKGAFDQWHIDYIHLDNNRSINDLEYKDIAYIYDAPSLLKDYYAMPYFHFVNNPIQYMSDSVETFAVNSSSSNLAVFNKIVIPDTTDGTTFYQYPASSSDLILVRRDTLIRFIYPLMGFAFPANKVNGPGTFESTFDIDFRPGGTQEPDFIRSNDTVIGKTVLENYYAYDDGTAEAGYGVNPSLSGSTRESYMAVEFNIPFAQDTLGGIQLYFLPQTFDVQKQSFVITVWNSLNPANVIYEKTIQNNPIFSDDNGYLNYGFDSSIIVNQTFYVGIKSIGVNSINMGYDLNTNHRDKIFWSQDGANWRNPTNGIFDGSLMLRPVFRQRLIGVGIEEGVLLQNQEVNVYPNPVSDYLMIEVENAGSVKEIQVIDLTGKLVRVQQFNKKVDVSSLQNGIYLMRLIGKSGEQLTKKFIVSR